MSLDKPTLIRHLPRFLNPLTDFGFKRIFGEATSLKAFLNSFLPQHHQIETLSYQSLEDLPDTVEGKRVVYDVLCKNQRGEYFLVELQNTSHRAVLNRFILYGSRLITSQLKKGEDYHRVLPVYCFNILNFNLPYYQTDKDNQDIEFNSPHPVHHFTLRSEGEEQLKLSHLVHYYVIQLPKFAKTETELREVQDKWLYLLRNLDKMESVPQSFKGDARFNEVFKTAEMAQLSEEEMHKYLHANDQEIVYKATIEYAREQGLEQGLEQGRAEGLEQGLAQGIEQGIEQGLEQGIEQGRQEKTQEIALAFLKQGVDIKTISQATGLSEDAIMMLKKRES